MEHQLSRIKVLVVSLHSLLADGVVSMLGRDTGIDILPAASIGQAVEALSARPHLVVVAGSADTPGSALGFVQLLQAVGNIPIVHILLEENRIQIIRVQRAAASHTALSAIVRQTASGFSSPGGTTPPPSQETR